MNKITGILFLLCLSVVLSCTNVSRQSSLPVSSLNKSLVVQSLNIDCATKWGNFQNLLSSGSVFTYRVKLLKDHQNPTFVDFTAQVKVDEHRQDSILSTLDDQFSVTTYPSYPDIVSESIMSFNPRRHMIPYSRFDRSYYIMQCEYYHRIAKALIIDQKRSITHYCDRYSPQAPNDQQLSFDYDLLCEDRGTFMNLHADTFSYSFLTETSDLNGNSSPVLVIETTSNYTQNDSNPVGITVERSYQRLNELFPIKYTITTQTIDNENSSSTYEGFIDLINIK